MATFGSLGKIVRKAGKGVKKLVTDPGEWAKNAGKSVLQAAPYAIGAAAIPGVGGLLGGGLSRIGLGGVASSIGKLGGGSLGGAIKSVGKYALSNPDLLLGGLSAYEGYKKGRESDKMLSRALNDPSLNPQRPDLSEVFSDYSNPYTMQMQPRNAGLPTVGRRRV